MGEELKAGCARPTGGPVGEPAPETNEEKLNVNKSIEETQSMIKVGQKAPDFTAPGYQKGKFINITLDIIFFV